MSVVGIDFGTLNTVVAVARNRGIDVITNEVSNRTTPSLVSFGEKQRYVGESGKTNEISNFKNTAASLKRLAGRSFDDPEVRSHEQKFVNCKLVEGERGEVAASVYYGEDQRIFTYTQLAAMFFSKVKEFTSKEIKAPMTDAVISVPLWFTDAQRRSIIEAATIAQINPLRLLNDTTAAALAYGITKTDLPDPAANTKPRNVVFVDLGFSSYQVAVVSFVKGKLTVKGTAYDRNFGGRDFDEVLVQHFIKEFDAKYKLDIKSSPKAVFRLRQGCEKVKKIISANPITMLNIECLLDDKDVQAQVTRELFEDLSKPLLDRLQAPLDRALAASGLTVKDIDFVELVGGSTRVAYVKDFLAKYFGGSPEKNILSTTMNQDEAVARGCALQCAIISPVFKVRDFTVQDWNHFPIQISWDASQTPSGTDGTIEAFPLGNVVPTTKNVTLFRTLDDAELERNKGAVTFDLEAHYQDSHIPPGAKKSIGTWTIRGIKRIAEKAGEQHINPTEQSKKATLKVKLKLDGDMIVGIDSVHQIEEVIVTTKDEGEKKEGEAEAAPKQKKVTRKHELLFASHHHGASKDLLAQWQALEGEMYASDRLVIDTADRKNAVEEYVYETRGKLDMAWSEFVSEDIRTSFVETLNETENWLYGDGEDATKSVYIEKLESLKKIGDPIEERYREFEERPRAEKAFREYVNSVIVDLQAEDGRYDHISAEDIQKVKTESQKKLDWINTVIGKQNELAKHATLAVTSAEINLNAQTLKWLVTPILSKPKPAPAAPAPEAAAAEPAAAETGAGANADQPMEEAPQAQTNMDVD
ncbi:heat shock protein 70 family [Polychytrium aggregatum]|uniref:heat shock protein 70 family n=1 Tax=Polychytrium aggregatum TaxID=110093 RepID=UPI0022FEB139|nr:heat shock protein 70 family [Polychytrium aggregatum]KAI9203611.1 heat shock protein 70 family [Polychytrium aggregatum]